MRSLSRANHIWLARRPAWLRYAVALAAAAAAQLARLQLPDPTVMPYITYVPFMVLSGALVGLGPGLLTTILCTLESIYFATEPTGSFAVGDPLHWEGIGLLAFTGLVITAVFEWVRRANAATEEMRVQLSRELEARQQTLGELRSAYAELAAIHANAPVGLLLVDEALRVRKVSDFAARFTGQSVQQLPGRVPGDVIGCLNALADPKGCGFASGCDDCPIRQAVLDTMRRGVEHHNLEAWLPVAGEEQAGKRCFLVSTASMQPNGSKKALVCALDITDHKRAEEDRRQSGARLEAALAESEANHSLLAAVFTALTDPILVCGTDARIVRTNPAASANWGFDSTGWHVADVMDKLGIRGGFAVSLTRKALLGETTINEEQKAGDRTLETSSAPMRDHNGRIVGAVVVPRDVTRRRRMKEDLERTVGELQSALEEKTVLLKEVHHRVKNNLAVISSVLGMKADAICIPEGKIALADSQQRVQSIALIHEHLYGQDRLNRINFAEYTEDLLQQMQVACVSEPHRIAIRSQLEAIELGVHRAVPCALILNELVSNACKHGFPDGRSGEIRVGFRACEAGFLELSVEDDGIGCEPPGENANGKSLGLRIVQILARQLEGAVRHETPAPPATGTRFVLQFPAGTAGQV